MIPTTFEFWRRAQMVKGGVCKTSMYRFDSDRRLIGAGCREQGVGNRV